MAKIERIINKDFDQLLSTIEDGIIVFRDDDVLKTELLSLSYSLFDTAYGAHFSAQTYLATHRHFFFVQPMSVSS